MTKEAETKIEKEGSDIETHRESCKLFFDFFKQMTTLCSGVIVLLATFLTKVVQSASNTDLIIHALWAFIAVIIASAFGMFVFASHIQGRKDMQESNRNLVTCAALVAGGGLIYGLCSLAYFATISLS